MAGCTPETKKIKGETTRDTLHLLDTTATMLVPEFGIKMADVCHKVGDYNIYFTPGADWTFTSQAAWLEVVTASGSKADTVLTVRVKQANESKEPRAAATTITVGGVAKTLTITQMGNTPTIKVFDRTIEFTSTVKTGTINNIFANCDLEILSVPEWVVNQKLNVIEAGYSYSIDVELKPYDYDSDEREGVIVLKDVASDFTFEISIICLRTSAYYQLDETSLENVPTGEITDPSLASRTFRFRVLENPEVEEDQDPLQLRFYTVVSGIYQTSMSVLATGGKIDVPAPKGPFVASTFEVVLSKYSYQDYNDPSVREIACFVLPESENSDSFDPEKNTPLFIVDQRAYIETAVNGSQLTKTYTLENGARTQDVKFDVREGLTPSVVMECGTNQETGLKQVWPGTIVPKGEPVANPKKEGWMTYTYTVTFDDPEGFSLGNTMIGGKPTPQGVWDCSACIYIDEYNPTQRVCHKFTLKKPAGIYMLDGDTKLTGQGSSLFWDGVSQGEERIIEVFVRDTDKDPKAVYLRYYGYDKEFAAVSQFEFVEKKIESTKPLLVKHIYKVVMTDKIFNPAPLPKPGEPGYDPTAIPWPNINGNGGTPMQVQFWLNNETSWLPDNALFVDIPINS